MAPRVVGLIIEHSLEHPHTKKRPSAVPSPGARPARVGGLGLGPAGAWAGARGRPAAALVAGESDARAERSPSRTRPTTGRTKSTRTRCRHTPWKNIPAARRHSRAPSATVDRAACTRSARRTAHPNPRQGATLVKNMCHSAHSSLRCEGPSTVEIARLREIASSLWRSRAESTALKRALCWPMRRAMARRAVCAPLPPSRREEGEGDGGSLSARGHLCTAQPGPSTGPSPSTRQDQVHPGREREREKERERERERESERGPWSAARLASVVLSVRSSKARRAFLVGTWERVPKLR